MWFRKWQIFLTLCAESVLTYSVSHNFIPSFLLEIRVIIKISSHPWYPDFNSDEQISKWPNQKTEIFKSASSLNFLAEIS